MSMKETKTDGRYHIDFSWVLFVPIVILLGIVPLVTRLAVINTDQVTAKLFGQAQIYDFFSQYKSVLIIGSGAIILFVLFLVFDKTKFKIEQVMKINYILIAVFLIFSLISTMTSKYREIAIWGIGDRVEGMVVIAAYIIIMVYTIYIINKVEDYKYIILPLAFLVVVTAVLGFFQFTGEDLLLTREMGKKLIVPEKYAGMKSGLVSSYESGKIYGTMYHYNYMGSFGAMMVPLFVTLTLFIKGAKKKSFFAIISLLSIFLLAGSTSRAGIIGLVCSLFAMIIIFSKKIISHYKVTIGVVVLAGITALGLNMATGGIIFERIPTLINDAIALFMPADKDFDYKEHIPVRDIRCEGNEMIIEIQGDQLRIDTSKENFSFKDSQNQNVEFIFDGNQYTTQDPRFNQISFEIKIIGENQKETYLMMKYNYSSVAIIQIQDNANHFVDSAMLEEMEIDYPETIGFKGKEKLGSSRGYIWSRSIPMLKETLVLGYGPDTYALEFPQNDLFGKWYAYDTPNIIVDKPHNLYLQIGINQGVIALLAFVGLLGVYIVQSLKLYTFKRDYDTVEAMGVGLVLSIVGYLGAGIFNDSIVSVAPIFWILLGCGIATNYIVTKQRKVERSHREYATIQMKTKKHILK